MVVVNVSSVLVRVGGGYETLEKKILEKQDPCRSMWECVCKHA